MLDENDNYLILKKIYLFTIGGCVGCGKNVYECLRSMGGWVAKKMFTHVYVWWVGGFSSESMFT